MLIKIGVAAAAVLALAIARPYIQKAVHPEKPNGAASVIDPPGASKGSNEHFSPAENLEELDIAALKQARRSVDIAMFAVTDRRLAQALNGLAVRTVKIRIYRDRGQFAEEEQKALRFREPSTTHLFHGRANIAVRVKQDGERTLMHSKMYCVDGRLLRDGSANWSPAGERTQDNSLHFSRDSKEIEAFERNFEGMWNRAANTAIQ